MGKAFVTLGALEWLLAAVEAPVLGQVVLVLESLVAVPTLVWTQIYTKRYHQNKEMSISVFRIH